MPFAWVSNFATARYDMIPNDYFDGSILEIGARTGKMQLESRHRERFLKANNESRYWGIDISPQENAMLNVSVQNFLEMDFNQKFDTIIASEVMEHIAFRDWPKAFGMMKNLLRPEGKIFITTPHNEQLKDYIHYYHAQTGGEYYQAHVTFGITKQVIQHFLPGATCKVLRVGARIKQKNESIAKGIIRFFYRILRRHPYALSWLPLAHSLVVYWRKA